MVVIRWAYFMLSHIPFLLFSQMGFSFLLESTSSSESIVELLPPERTLRATPFSQSRRIAVAVGDIYVFFIVVVIFLLNEYFLTIALYVNAMSGIKHTSSVEVVVYVVRTIVVDSRNGRYRSCGISFKVE